MPTHPDSSIPNPLEQLTLDQLRTRRSAKWTTHPADVLPLWVAEMDVLLAPPIAEAVHHAIAVGDTGYPAGQAYARALASFARDRWGWDGIEAERTAIVPDVMMGIVESLRLITDPGDAVVVYSPVYPPFYAFVSHADRRVIEAPLGTDGRLDLNALADAFTVARQVSDRPVLLLCNPHNPTGVVHARVELTAVAALGRQHGVRVISDEIHAPLVLAGAHFVPYLSVPGTDNAFACSQPQRAGISPVSRPRCWLPAPTPPMTWPGCPKRSATDQATSASSPIAPPSTTVRTGSMPCWPGLTTTAASSAT
jgi:cysteine-S-conjugate beta-lyase